MRILILSRIQSYIHMEIAKKKQTSPSKKQRESPNRV